MGNKYIFREKSLFKRVVQPFLCITSAYLTLCALDHSFYTLEVKRLAVEKMVYLTEIDTERTNKLIRQLNELGSNPFNPLDNLTYVISHPENLKELIF